MSKHLPPRPDIDQLKKQARDLLQAYQAARPEALSRIRAHLPRLSGAPDAEILQARFTLQNAQHVVAREYGFTGWTELSDAVAPQGGERAPRNDREVQALLSQLDKTELALFLWASGEGVQETVLSRATEYLRDFVEEELEFLGPMAPWFQPGGDAEEPRIASFDDLVELSDREIQATLREVDRRECALALLRATSTAQEKILTNMSRRVRRLLEEDMASLEASADEIAEAQAVFLGNTTVCCQRVREEVRGQVEAVRERFRQIQASAAERHPQEQARGALRNLLVDCARQARRDGIASLRTRGDLTAQTQIIVGFICRAEGEGIDEAKMILKAMLLIMEGTAADEVDGALRM